MKPQDAGDDELARARDVLARTVRFLSRCAEDPDAAVQSEDPRELIRGLQALAGGTAPHASPASEAPAKESPRAMEAEELPTIPLRKRRSA